MESEQIESILDFWFGPLEDEFDFPEEKAKFWFRGGEAFNETIREKFSDRLEEAQSGALDAWREEPRGLLALLILLDQFPRNLHHDASAFVSDEKSLEMARHAVLQSDD